MFYCLVKRFKQLVFYYLSYGCMLFVFNTDVAYKIYIKFF
ncbi:hypothetical protein P20652_0806 [Pseudoalteromonas sp. BSi20652]|nr:hypothetical protein P20652_0806 [Pseudoalteromonas sp. BSi20652]